jgi:hypothetical protein
MAEFFNSTTGGHYIVDNRYGSIVDWPVEDKRLT